MTLIKPGDEVRLKSGGPMMTVSAVEEDEAVCHWFESKLQKVSRFSIIILISKADIPTRTVQAIRPRRSHDF
jgi:uncharacterized protein YodC (DUF2158 family)